MTSVSRSEHDDEAPEGTGTGVSADRGASSAPRTSRAKKSTSTTTTSTEKPSAGTSAGAKTSAAKSGAAKSGAAKSATAAKKPRAPRTAAAAVAAESTAEASVGPAEETAAPAPSKRTPASRAASAKASTARGEAAKSSRQARTTTAASTPAARSRAAAAATTKRQTQRVAASVTTETTAAERAGRKTASAPAVESEIDETTRERSVEQRQADAARRAAASIAAAAVADDAIAPRAVVETPAAAAPVAAPAEPAPVEAAPVEAAPVEAAPVEIGPAESVPAEALPVEVVPADGSAPDTAASDTATVDQAVVVIPPKRTPAPRKKRTLRVARPAPAADAPRVLAIEGLVKRFGAKTAVDGISLEVRAGSFFGIVGPNGAGKTTTLSMITGLLRPDAGLVRIHDIDAWKDPIAAKRATGVLPDRLRLFDRLTGAQLLSYSGTLRGLDHATVRERSADLIAAFGLDDAVDRLVADYSAGMTKKIALACAMIHAPRLLVLDEPFESVDPVSAANLTDILERYVAGGGTVVLSSHSMDLIERVCDSAAIIIGGQVLAQGALDEVRAGQTLEDRFVELAGGRKAAEGMEWLHSFTD